MIMFEKRRTLLYSTKGRLKLSTELEDVFGTAEKAKEKREQRSLVLGRKK
jgi:hypothetical protein